MNKLIENWQSFLSVLFILIRLSVKRIGLLKNLDLCSIVNFFQHVIFDGINLDSKNE
jgi:hypothetical protein